MTVHYKTATTAVLGNTERILLELVENPAAEPYPEATGLYHFAIIYPTEKELAEAVAWLFMLRYANSPTDHGYSKTTYLEDPDGTTIELYIRTPERAVYTENDSGEMVVNYADGQVGNGRDPLNMNELFGLLNDKSVLDAPLTARTAMGHVHLFTHSIDEMLTFYRDVIGFGEGMMVESFKMGDVALSKELFHVIAFNEWKGNVPPPPDIHNGMHHYTLVVPDDKAYSELRARIEKAEIAATPHQDGYFIKDPAGLMLYITQDDSKVAMVHDIGATA